VKGISRPRAPSTCWSGWGANGRAAAFDDSRARPFDDSSPRGRGRRPCRGRDARRPLCGVHRSRGLHSFHCPQRRRCGESSAGGAPTDGRAHRAYPRRSSREGLGRRIPAHLPSRQAAVLAGLELIDARPEPLRQRIGMHHGEVHVERDHDVVGNVENAAARGTEAARGGEVLATAAVRDNVGELPGVSFGRLGHRKLKGIDERVRVCPIRRAQTTHPRARVPGDGGWCRVHRVHSARSGVDEDHARLLGWAAMWSSSANLPRRRG